MCEQPNNQKQMLQEQSKHCLISCSCAAFFKHPEHMLYYFPEKQLTAYALMYYTLCLFIVLYFYYNYFLFIRMSCFSLGTHLWGLTPRSGNLALKDERARLTSASWRTSLCNIKTNQTVNVGSCLDATVVGTCLPGLFVCCDGLWGGETLPPNWPWVPE